MASLSTSLTRQEWSWPNGRAGLLLLLQAHECATATESECWDFAVEITELRERGISENELRWLLKMSYVEHRIEATLIGDETRCFLPQGGMKFTPTSCFILTVNGELYVRMLLHPPKASVRSEYPNGSHSTSVVPVVRTTSVGSQDRLSGSSPRIAPSPGEADITDQQVIIAQLSGVRDSQLSTTRIGEFKSPNLPNGLRPSWDMERKELWFGQLLIKRFRFQSPNQETILMVFHEEGWPPKIDDPLPPVPNQTSRQRLHDAIKNLNRHRLNRSIRFAGDGTGEGVKWERED